MEPSLEKKPRFDHPMLTLAIVTVTLSLVAAFTTLRLMDSVKGSDTCADVIGEMRVEMGQTKVPSVFDEKAWEDLTNSYNKVFESCDPETAAQFAAEEFDPWAAPALSALRPTTNSTNSSTNPGSSSTPTTTSGSEASKDEPVAPSDEPVVEESSK